MKKILDIIIFEEAWNNFRLSQFFKNTIEYMEEVNTLFDGAISTSSRVNKLTKLEDPGKCVVPYTILGDEFLDAPCATWSIVILVSKDIAERLGIGIKAPRIILAFANLFTKSPHDDISNLDLRVGNCIIPIEF